MTVQLTENWLTLYQEAFSKRAILQARRSMAFSLYITSKIESM